MSSPNTSFFSSRNVFFTASGRQGWAEGHEEGDNVLSSRPGDCLSSPMPLSFRLVTSRLTFLFLLLECVHYEQFILKSFDFEIFSADFESFESLQLFSFKVQLKL